MLIYVKEQETGLYLSLQEARFPISRTNICTGWAARDSSGQNPGVSGETWKCWQKGGVGPVGQQHSPNQ